MRQGWSYLRFENHLPLVSMSHKRMCRAIQFQLVDLEYETKADCYEAHSPLVILYGRQMNGQPVTLSVDGFFPYMYMDDIPGASLDDLKKDLNYRIDSLFCLRGTDNDQNAVVRIINKSQYRAHGQYVHLLERVTRCNVYGYNAPRTFIKVTLYNPKDIPVVRNALWEKKWEAAYSKQTYECDFLFVLRFLVDKQIRGAGWVQVDQVSGNPCSAHESHVRGVDLTQAAPLRILSFDIEVAGRRGHFPSAEEDPIIQIANYVTLHGAPPDPVYGTPSPISYCLFQWKPYDKPSFNPEPPGATIVVCRSEKDLLERWREYVCEQDPDFITGWNTNSFDIPYVIDRMKMFHVPPRLGRGKSPSYYQKGQFNSKAYGRQDRLEPFISGRVLFDMLPIVRREHKLRSYKLDAVAEHFLGEHKVVSGQEK